MFCVEVWHSVMGFLIKKELTPLSTCCFWPFQQPSPSPARAARWSSSPSPPLWPSSSSRCCSTSWLEGLSTSLCPRAFQIFIQYHYFPANTTKKCHRCHFLRCSHSEILHKLTLSQLYVIRACKKGEKTLLRVCMCVWWELAVVTVQREYKSTAHYKTYWSSLGLWELGLHT